MPRSNAQRSFRRLSRALHLVVLSGACTLATYSNATPCLYKGANADTRVINRSGEITTPFPTPLSANDCRRLRVVTESVTVWVVNSGISASSSSQITKGQLVPSSELADPIGSDTFGIIKQIGLVLAGINRTKTGSSRGGEEDFLVASLPTGKLMEPLADLLLELGPVPDRNLAGFELIRGGKVQHRQTGPAQAIKLPQSTLKAGNQMRWKLDYAGKKYEGQFTVEPADRSTAIKQAVQVGSDSTIDPISDALRFASALALEGFGWDSREVIRVVLADSQIQK